MPIVSVIVPVLNERGNILPLIARLDAVLAGLEWEVVFVDDDSVDGTADFCRKTAFSDERVRVIQRVGRLGLATACVEGILATSSPFVVVMDGDLQHDERRIPEMLRLAQQEGLDVVIASRNLAVGGMGDFSAQRVRLSNLGKRLTRMLVQCEISDPMSGFFLLDRRFFHEVVHDLSQIGFKILLDLIASSKRPVQMAEVPYVFRTRLTGESKLDTSVSIDFLLLLADKIVGEVVPVRYALYSLIGLIGIGVHMTVLTIAHRSLFMPLGSAQALATSVAIICNFLLNNTLTYRDRKLKGTYRVLKGLLVYSAGCVVGAIASVAIAELLMRNGYEWYLAGLGGIAVSSVWNYAIASAFTWKLLQRRRAFAGLLWRSANKVHPSSAPVEIGSDI